MRSLRFHSKLVGAKICQELTKEENVIEFYKKHGKIITNIAIVLLVLGAIYEKSRGEGSEALFRADDLYLLAGAVLAFILLRLFTKRQQGRERT